VRSHAKIASAGSTMRRTGGHARVALRPLALSPLAVLLLTLSACGSSNSTRPSAHSSPAEDFGSEASASQAQPIEAAFHGYLLALAEARWSRACSYLTAPARNRKAHAGAGLTGRSRGCRGGLRVSTKNLNHDALAKASASSVRIEGERAYAFSEDGTMRLRREGGEWKVIDFASALPIEAEREEVGS